MKKLLTPKKGTSGVYEGRSVVGWRGFILVETDNSAVTTPMFHNRLQVASQLEFPDEANSKDFMTRLRENLKGFDKEKHDFEEFFRNQVAYTAEAYHAELTVDPEAQGKKKSKSRGAA